ncbi:6398_t:CDS:2, partial [Gigaspora margarita]
VSQNEKRDHIDGYYCLVSVKNARNFASVFADQSVILSQDDKAKVSVGIPAIGRHFETMQTILEPVSETDKSLRVVQLSIFIRAQWHLGSSFATHMTDILSLVSNKRFDGVFRCNDEVKPLWVLLVDGGPDENLRHFKNIVQYCKLFCSLNLDYLTIRTHALGQLAYNSVERSMLSLSKKVAGITLPIDHFGNHLDSQGNVQDYELGLQNFHYAGQALADLWRRDLIYGKPVFAKYVDGQTNPFSNILSSINENELENKKNEENSENNDDLSVAWSWIESHCNLYRYSLDIRKCNNLLCCSPKRAEEAVALLSASNRFLPPLIKEKDGHYLNTIHTLEYFDSIKIPSYDAYLPSLSSENYVRHCKQPRSKSATIEDFSMLSCSLGITDHEFIAIAVAL